MAQKNIKIRLNRTMQLDGALRHPGYETVLDTSTAEKWLRNGRIEVVTTGAARPKAGDADPTQAPPAGSPAGSGAQSSSRPRGRPRKDATLTSSAVPKPPAS